MCPALPDAPDRSQGMYETMLVRDGRVLSLAGHLERLARSIDELYGLELPAELASDVRDHAAGLAGEHRLRVDVPGPGPSGRIGFRSAPVAPGLRRPVALAPVLVPGGLGAHKWRDRRLVDSHGADPVPLLIDEDDSVLEAAWGNFWIVDGDRLITPPADGRILPGVTRRRLLDLAPGLGLQAREQPVGLADARTATTAFLTSSVRLTVVAALGSAPADPDPIVDRLHAALGVF